MDVVGSEIGQKMRSAIKAKLTELGCYVDDELPDYVMVMVANKRTRAQMEDDLQLFLGDNTELFVNWLHQVLKKLQEVTVSAPLKAAEGDKGKERSKSKDKKSKDKKDKSKKKSESAKKSKKKSKEKALKKKEEKKLHKSKKKHKHHDIIRPNIPPLLMNMEKVSEPSITDVFAGQILKNHGVLLDSHVDESKSADSKPKLQEMKRPILPIIDPATIPSQAPPDSQPTIAPDIRSNPSLTIVEAPQDEAAKPPLRDEQIKEINEIEAKIQGLKQKLAEQLDSMSDDEDFLTIRTEAEELMNDFAEDVFQEISQPPPVTPPTQTRKSPPPPSPPSPPSPSPPPPSPPPPTPTLPKDIPEVLPHIELNLPKRPIRERLGARKVPEIEPAQEKPVETKIKEKSPERFTPEKEPEIRPPLKSAKSRLGSQPEPQKKPTSDGSDKVETSRRMTSSRPAEGAPPRAGCASVVRVRPRPRGGAPAASTLLLRAVADAHKSLLNIPPKIDPEPQKVKRALVLPMRRCVETQKIVISVPRTERTGSGTPADSVSNNVGENKLDNDQDDKKPKRTRDNLPKDEYIPMAITKVIHNTDYMSSRTIPRHEDSLLVDTINIHNTTVDKAKDTQFIVTMDGYHPNAFLAKKLMTEGLLNDEEEIVTKAKENPHPVLVSKDNEGTKKVVKVKTEPETTVPPIFSHIEITSVEKSDERPVEKEKELTEQTLQKPTLEKRGSDVIVEANPNGESDNPPVKKRKASPIVFDVNKKVKEVDKVRERTLSTSSDGHVTITTVNNTHKYDALPPLSSAERKVVWCRSFPQCRYGAACAFQHPRCKFAAACTRRACAYSHAPGAPPAPPAPLSPLSPPPPSAQPPVVASHVVPAANYKSISAGAFANLCKYYPNCSNPACHFYHPKPCRYGKACSNKLECNFYHQEVPPAKWKFSL